MNNISKVSFEICTGCNACLQICPKHCIVHNTKEDGFWYPHVNAEQCIECGLCIKVCPALSPLAKRKPIFSYAGYNIDNKIRMKSSSGGIFMELAKCVISEGGIVFGAVFDSNWNVIHKAARTIDEVYPMLGSKYLQCDTKNTFAECREYLNEGLSVLYSGTPCQIEGLHKFLRKEYENLFTLDFICHGVPSPGIWQKYLHEIANNNAAIKAAAGKNSVLNSSLNAKSPIGDIKFRDKTDGWEKFRFVVRQKSAFKADQNTVLLSDIYSNNPYMRGFLNDLYLRESCYHCPARGFSSQSDITIGDFWGVHKLNMDDINDQKGLSIITINSSNGKYIFNSISKSLLLRWLTFEQVIESNPNLLDIAPKNDKKINRFKRQLQVSSFEKAIEVVLHISFWDKLLLKFKYKLGLIK